MLLPVFNGVSLRTIFFTTDWDWMMLLVLHSVCVSGWRQFYFCSDAKHRKLSQSQHAVDIYFQHFSLLTRHRCNSWLIYKCRELGNKKNCFSTFCAYKAWWRTERRECTKVIMSPPFSDEKLIWNCPDFSYKGRRHQGCMFTLSPQNVLSQPQNYSRSGEKKWFRCSRCCVHPLPPISYWIAFSCLLEGFGEEHYKRNSYTDVCLVFVQQSAESGCRLWWVFIRKSYLKRNLSWAACGKHCHVRETAKPYKAFPPKGST